MQPEGSGNHDDWCMAGTGADRGSEEQAGRRTQTFSQRTQPRSGPLKHTASGVAAHHHTAGGGRRALALVAPGPRRSVVCARLCERATERSRHRGHPRAGSILSAAPPPGGPTPYRCWTPSNCNGGTWWRRRTRLRRSHTRVLTANLLQRCKPQRARGTHEQPVGSKRRHRGGGS